MNKPLILASQSPRRAEILQQMGVSFVQVSPDAEELVSSPDGPSGVVRENALIKARAVARDYPQQWVLAADTVVVIDGDILGKPRDLPEAWQMLARLSGRQHEVYTGYALYRSDLPKEIISKVAVSKVTFRPLTLQDIQEYCRLVNPLDKAGAYGIQEETERILSSLQGSFSNVMGLPKEELEPHLQRIGVLEYSLDAVRQEAVALVKKWAQKLLPHYGPTGSMDLDRKFWPQSLGPSYYNQFAYHTLLLLATGKIPGCTEEEKEVYKQTAIRNIEYVLSITDEEYRTPHYSRGAQWGTFAGEWLNYYMLCALELMDEGNWCDTTLHNRVRETVHGAVGVLYKLFVTRNPEMPKKAVGNHSTWHALLLYRAGRYFGNEEWTRFGEEFMLQGVLVHQHPSGYWPEGGGIVVNYGMVTALAVSIYAELSGNKEAAKCVGRFLKFYDYMTFPDRTNSVSVDIRMHYSKRPFLFLPPGFVDYPEGRAFAILHCRVFRQWLENNELFDNAAQGFAFFGSFLEGIFKERNEKAEGKVEELAPMPVARVKSGPWQGYISWQIVEEHPGRFIMESQNFVELWHRDAGYLLGTGGSRMMPSFSTIRRTTAGRAYIPDSARCIRADETSAEVVYDFGGDEIGLTYAVSEEECCLSASLLKGNYTYETAVILALEEGEVLRLNDREYKIDPNRCIEVWATPGQPFVLEWRGLKWELPENAFFAYPNIPYNPYTQNKLPPPSDYTARISFVLNREGRSIRVRSATAS